MTACWAEEQSQRPSMQQMIELLRQLYANYTGQRPPELEGHASRAYEIPVPFVYDDAQVTQHRLPGAYARVSCEGNEKNRDRENFPAATGTGSTIGMQMQNPVFDAGHCMASGASVVYNLDGDKVLRNVSSTDDESSAVYDLGTANTIQTTNNLYDIGNTSESTGTSTSYTTAARTTTTAATTSNDRCATTAGRSSVGCAPRGEANGVCNFDSTDNDSGSRRILGTERSQKAMLRRQVAAVDRSGDVPASAPTSSPRILSLAWEEPSSETDTPVLDPQVDTIYGNQVQSETIRRAVTASDIGRHVTVQDYACGGVLRFIGPHHERGTTRCGVELEEPLGKNDGTVGVSGEA